MDNAQALRSARKPVVLVDRMGSNPIPGANDFQLLVRWHKLRGVTAVYVSIVSATLSSKVSMIACLAIKFEKSSIRIHINTRARDINAIRAICIEVVQTPKIWNHGVHH